MKQMAGRPSTWVTRTLFGVVGMALGALLCRTEPDDPAVQAMVIEVYKSRILDAESNTLEVLAYLDPVIAARRLQLAAR
jgi:hypothetical protein